MLGSLFGFDPFEQATNSSPAAEEPQPQAPPATGAGFPSHMSVVNDGPMNSPVNKTQGGFKIQVCVDSPQRSTGYMPHVQYRVRCTTNLPNFVNQSTVVWRRYSDFEWLRSRLHAFNAGIIVPPIPEKTVLAFDDPQHSVVVERTFLLQWFLQQVAAHPVLAESLELRLFIESTSTELKEWYERGYIGEAITGASTMLESMTTTVKETADKPAVELTDQQLEEMWPSPPWAINDMSTLAYLATAEEAMCKLCLCSEKIADQHDEQARALFAFANGLTEIGNAEDKTCDIIAAWAMESGAVKSKARLSMGAFGAYMRDYIIGAFKQQGPQINFFLYLALKKCHLLIKAAKEMILDHMECVEARKAAIRQSEGKKRVLKQIQGTNMDATGGLLRSATDEAARAEEGRVRQELRLQQFGERGERELAKFITLRAALVGPALKSFIKLQGGLAGHTAASMNDFRKLHLNVPNVLQVRGVPGAGSSDNTPTHNPSRPTNNVLSSHQTSQHSSSSPPAPISDHDSDFDDDTPILPFPTDTSTSPRTIPASASPALVVPNPSPIQPSTVSVPPPPAFLTLNSARSSHMSWQQSEYEDVPLGR